MCSNREENGQHSSLVYLRFDADVAEMAFDDAIYERQPDAIALVALGIMTAIEGFEQMRKIFFGNANAMILEFQYGFSCITFQEDRYTVVHRILTAIVEYVNDGGFQ